MIDKDLKTIADHFGEKQPTKLIEEIGELLQALAKLDNNDTQDNVLHLLEEIADVEIVLEQIKYQLDGLECVKNIKQQKIQRTLKRIKSGYYK